MLVVDTPKYNEIFTKIAEKAYTILEFSGNAIVEVDFVSKDEIRSLNASTRQIDKVTDVLSYPSLYEITAFTKANYPFEYDEDRKGVNIGNIVICEDVAKEQAQEYGHSEERETCYLFTHGLMHLLGYDHIEEEDKNEMRAREEEVLSALGISRE